MPFGFAQLFTSPALNVHSFSVTLFANFWWMKSRIANLEIASSESLRMLLTLPWSDYNSLRISAITLRSNAV